MGQNRQNDDVIGGDVITGGGPTDRENLQGVLDIMGRMLARNSDEKINLYWDHLVKSQCTFQTQRAHTRSVHNHLTGSLPASVNRRITPQRPPEDDAFIFLF